MMNQSKNGLAGEAAQPPDEVAIRWIEAIQGAIGNMGRLGDRDYFTFAMWLVFEQAENDGLIPRDSRTKSEIDRLRPIIDEKKKILCLTPPVASAQPEPVIDYIHRQIEKRERYLRELSDKDKCADNEFDFAANEMEWLMRLISDRTALSPAQAVPPANLVSDYSLPSCHVCGSPMTGLCPECKATTAPSEPSAQAVAGENIKRECVWCNAETGSELRCHRCDGVLCDWVCEEWHLEKVACWEPSSPSAAPEPVAREILKSFWLKEDNIPPNTWMEMDFEDKRRSRELRLVEFVLERAEKGEGQ